MKDEQDLENIRQTTDNVYHRKTYTNRISHLGILFDTVQREIIYSSMKLLEVSQKMIYMYTDKWRRIGRIKFNIKQEDI